MLTRVGADTCSNEHQPGIHFTACGQAVGRQEFPGLFGQIKQHGVAVEHDGIAIHQSGSLGVRVDLEERRIVLLALAVLSIVMPAIRAARKPRDERASLADSILHDESIQQIEKAHDELAAQPDLLTSTVRSVDASPRARRKARKNSKENEK